MSGGVPVVDTAAKGRRAPRRAAGATRLAVRAQRARAGTDPIAAGTAAERPLPRPYSRRTRPPFPRSPGAAAVDR